MGQKRETTALLLLLALSAAAADIHVSPTGSDAAGTGSAAQPYATLGRAQRAARAALAAGPLAANLTVRLAPGVYYQSAPLRFTAADSGKAVADELPRCRPSRGGAPRATT